jgi:ribonucleoside-diphosphate reductase alpha chain
MYGDPGFQYDWDTQVLRNACTEVISADDCDSCCIGSVNLSKIRNLAELKEIVELGTVYLLCNTLYTDWPVAKVGGVKEKNRRLGLGLMGLAEWFVQRQQPYGYNNPADKRLYAEDHISNWLRSYQDESIYAAVHWAGVLDVAVPIAIRAIAPTGTISALGHTTPGIEPIFHTAYQRTYNTLKTQDHADGFIKVKVIDPIVMKWIEQGYNIDDIDTAYTLSQSSEGIERRLAFQAFVQQYVDNGISSTVNLPPYQEGMEIQLAPILLKYLPQLRGVTFYPDGRYSNQPVVPLDIHEVLADNDSVMGQYESCKLDGGCGS